MVNMFHLTISCNLEVQNHEKDEARRSHEGTKSATHSTTHILHCHLHTVIIKKQN